MTNTFVPSNNALEEIGAFIAACNHEIVEGIMEAWANNPAPTIFDPIDAQVAWMLPEE